MNLDYLAVRRGRTPAGDYYTSKICQRLMELAPEILFEPVAYNGNQPGTWYTGISVFCSNDRLCKLYFEPSFRTGLVAKCSVYVDDLNTRIPIEPLPLEELVLQLARVLLSVGFRDGDAPDALVSALAPMRPLRRSKKRTRK